ncbi:unnamed protein product [Durusdinium trenchii]|uniref:sn-1-specific diacylglycerol lipase n=1 Tax=Durusdinium trenchii TaxID=1381693 RepID=A0ABP0KNJ3_9DINO
MWSGPRPRTKRSLRQAAATDAVEHARGSVVSLSTVGPVPCAVCGQSTKSGDGGACGDVGDMAVKDPKDDRKRCYSCLSAAERDQVVVTVKEEHLTLDSFFAGEPPPVHVDPEETVLEKAHRLGSLALGGAVDLMGWIPVVGSVTKGTIKVLHKVVKFGPLALYSAELVETLQLLVVMANRTGVAKAAEEEIQEGTKASSGRALEVSEMSVGFYYLLLEHRNRAALDPDGVLREHGQCPKVEASVLDELVDCLPLATPVAYAASAAEAQRQLRLLGNWELVLREPQGPGGQPAFVVAVDRRAKRVAVLVPGTQSPGDCVTDLKALPVRVVADGSSVGWVHRGMMRQACAIVRIVGSALERFEKDGYEVLFIGHSLGAGVSAIAGAICRLGIEGVKLKKVRSLCYATPAVGNGSFGKFCEGHAVTVINCEDIVPRLSIETARKLREELSSRREAVRLFVAEDIEALKDINNITEKKTRSKSASLTAAEVQQGEEAAKELAELGIPAPQPGTSAKVAVEESMEAKAKKVRKQKGFLCCTTAQEDSEPEAEEEIDDLLEPDDTDPADIRLVPPGRLLHLARHSGARRAWWIRRNHPVLHRIQVHHGIGQDHSGDSYREGLQEALLAANGIVPQPWAPVDQAAVCACCSTDFVWSTVLRSEPHRLAARCRCHACGAVVCDGCSQRKQALPKVGILREVRVCDRCFLKPSALR